MLVRQHFFRYLKLALAELADLLTHAEKEN